MNDHIAGAGALIAFRASLGTVVGETQAAGARVILKGFMQQNAAWRLEDPGQTLSYNLVIARVAQAKRSKAVAELEAWSERAALNALPASAELTDQDVLRMVKKLR
jgi:hypothetical protein